MTNKDAKVELEWGAPPPALRKTMYDDVLLELEKRPGQWARIRSGMSSSGAASAGAQLRAHLERREPKTKNWEVVYRRLEEDETYGLWVRLRTKEQMQEAK